LVAGDETPAKEAAHHFGQPVTNARAYEVQYKNGGGWLPAGIFTQARRIEINGLTPGSAYTVQVRAIGGSTGYSDWTATQPVFAT
jgi:hypothetical protein